MKHIKLNFFIALSLAIVFVSGLALAIIYLWLIYILPLSESFVDTVRQYTVLEEQQKYFKQSVSPSLSRDIPDFDGISRLYFMPVRGPEMIYYLEKMAKKNNLTHTQTPASGNPPVVNYTVRGNFRDIMKLLGQLENGSFLLNIKSFSIRGSGATLEASMQITLAVQ
jgi:hypothetical protein